MLHLISGLLYITPYILYTYTTLFKKRRNENMGFIHCSNALKCKITWLWFCQLSIELKKPQYLNESPYNQWSKLSGKENALLSCSRYERLVSILNVFFRYHPLDAEGREKKTSEHTHIYTNINMNTNTTMWIMQFICMAWLCELFVYVWRLFFSLSSSSTVLNKHMQNIRNKRFYFVYE